MTDNKYNKYSYELCLTPPHMGFLLRPPVAPLRFPSQIDLAFCNKHQKDTAVTVHDLRNMDFFSSLKKKDSTNYTWNKKLHQAFMIPTAQHEAAIFLLIACINSSPSCIPRPHSTVEW